MLKIDYLFLIDVSGSMADSGKGHPAIFPKVVDAVSKFVAGVAPGTTVYIAPFAEKIREVRRFDIQGPSDLLGVNTYLGQLKADGYSTAVYNSIQAACDYVNKIRAPELRNGNPFIFNVYTDGEDNVSNVTLAQILKDFQLGRGDYDWLFYTELGLPRNQEREATFESHEQARYVTEKSGEVRPIIQVEARLPFMNFGNVMETKSPERHQQFVVRGTQPLPAGFTIDVEPRFEKLSSAGVLLQIEPEHVPVTQQPVTLRLTLTNLDSLAHGKYEGKLRFRPSSDMVMVVPNEIDAVFAYEPPKRIVVSSAPGETLPIEFGTVPANGSVTRHLTITPDDEARRAALPISFQLTELTSNPVRVGLGKAVFVDRQRGVTEGTLAGKSGEMTLVVQPPPDLPPGMYGGSVDIIAPGASISSEGATSGSADRLSVPWHFRVPNPPPPWWLWPLAAVAVVAIVIVGYHIATRPPRLPDLQLQLLKPRTGVIDLTGRHVERFGPSTTQLTDAQADFAIRAQKKGGYIAAVLELQSGSMHIMRQNMKLEVLESEDLQPGDRIVVGSYEMRVESDALSGDYQ